MGDLRVVDRPGAHETGRVPDWGGQRVPAGHIVRTGYVPIHDVIVHAGQGHQLSPAAVERAFCRQLELDEDQAWPPATGYWRDDGRFVLTDGRTRVVAALMLGMQYVLIAWLVPPQGAVSPELCTRCGGTGFDGSGEPCLYCRNQPP